MFEKSSNLIQGIFKKRLGIQPHPGCSPSTRLRFSSNAGQAFRRSTFGLLFIFSLITLQSCGLDVEDSTPPSKTQWVQKSLAEEWPERGIDAHETGGIFLEWAANLEEDIVAYNIYRATWYDGYDSLGDYSLISRIATASISETEYIDTQAQLRVRYFYKLKAEDTSNNMSEESDSAFYSLLPAYPSDMMTPNGMTISLGIDRSLKWYGGFSVEMEDYCLTLLTQIDEIEIRKIIQPNDYVGAYEEWQIPNDVILEHNKVYKWRIDTGAEYIDGRETTGSESPWATFLYLGE
ncbi:hypothetical protein HQ531_06710 [bacterium]|nr:hypothetical protein [bacterium]